MPQGTNLNISPYYDDFDKTKNYYKVLFKPGFPVQARELTTLQSIFQNQVESFGNYVFKEGSVVIPGGISYQNYFYALEVQSSFAGIDIGNYLQELEGKRIRGASSNIVAKVVKVLYAKDSIRNSNTLYVMYESSGGNDNSINQFLDAETLLLEENLVYGTSTIFAGEGFAVAKSTQSNSVASSVTVNTGVYFVRGTFVDVENQTIILDQYSNTPSYRVGFSVVEKIITADQDNSLYDNSLGSSNFSAPGADRLQIKLILTKKNINDFSDENFVEILRIKNGVTEFLNTNTQLNLIREELAKRTFDESGDYVVSPFSIFVKDSLNDNISNNGIYNSPVGLSNGNIAGEDVQIYQISPGKAYVKGFDINSNTSNFIDVIKPRTTKSVVGKQIPYNSGLSVDVNRIYGSPLVGLGTTAILSLRDSRITSIGYSASGSEIGVARLYDFSPNGVYVDDSSTANLRLFDVQTYTTITLSSSITLSTPALIEGKSSGARGYLKENVSNSTTLKLYQVNGNFIRNEQIIVNDEDNGRLIINVRDYDLSDVKSIYSLVGVSTFNADLVLSNSKLISNSGTIFNITASNAGISTISSPAINFSGISTVGQIISYGNVGTSQTSIIYNRIESIGSGGTSITVSQVQSVNKVNIGTLPLSNTTITNLAIVSPIFSNKENSSLYTPIGNTNVSSVDFKNSEIKIRYQFTNRNVTASSITITITETDHFFDAFDGSNYLITYSDGTFEPSLRADEFSITNGGKTLTINGLSKVTGVCNITTSLRKLNSKSKNKTFNRSNTLVINRSKLTSSGIGSTTLNDGLTYSTIYGTRIQDKEISLNVPDVVRILGIYESSGTSDPALPTITLNSFSGPNNSTIDYVVGEKVIGNSSKSVAIIVTKLSSNQLEVVYLTKNKFTTGEIISSEDSLINSTIVSFTVGDNNITENYTFDNGQRDAIYDYSRIIRKPQFSSPSKKIKIVFQNYVISSSDSGDFITASSYSSERYKNDVPTYNSFRNTDILDIRPRVSEYSSSNTYSPFEFSARNFAVPGNYSSYPVTPNKNVIVNYSYYLPRIDKIFLNKEGKFIISQGVPADNPEFPPSISESLEIASIFLPAYLYDTKDAKIVLAKNRRYTMSDISKLEDRIERTERLTSLNLLELDAKNLTIKDSITGLDRFKTGIFVDNFKNHNNHDISDDNFRACIDKKEAVLRPQSYSTNLDLQLGSESISGFSTSYLPNADLSYVSDLGSANVKKTGDLVTLTYRQLQYKNQPFATRVESVTPFLVTLWEGNVETIPSTDNWINEKILSANNSIGNYNDLTKKLGADIKSGLSPVDYITDYLGTLKGTDTLLKGNYTFDTIESSEAIGKNRPGIQFLVNESVTSNDGKTEYTEIVKYIRERNIEIRTTNLKPYTRHYAFFDNVDVSSYIVPKLLEIQMISGTFKVGETIKTKLSDVKSLNSSEPYINFRLCTPNHKIGPYNNPFEIYFTNPYTEGAIETEYSSSSTFLNVDTTSLQLKSESNYYGWVSVGMQLIGETSGAIARIVDLKLVTDSIGKVIASLYIPDASIPNLPRFETGTKILRLTSSKLNTTLNIPGASESAAEGKFTANGTIKTNFRDSKVTVRTIVPPATGASGGGDRLVIYIDSFTGRVVKYERLTGNQKINISGPTATSAAIILIGDSASYTGFVRSGVVNGNQIFVNSREDLINLQRSGIITPKQVIEAQIAFKSSTGVPNADATYIAQVVYGLNCPTRDPLAQTFRVDEESGVFIQSVGIFFFQKDEKLPVTLQIRTVSGGTPTEEILPFSEVTVYPEDVATSEDSLSVTPFIFSSPVYLPGGKEYAITLLSNSTNYKVFIARLGEVDVNTLSLPENNRIIVSKQPTLGSLFKSQNASTWTPSQYEDLKYVIYRCQFTDSAGTVKFFNPKLGIGNDKISKLGKNSILTLSKKITVGLGSVGYASSVTPGVTIIQGTASGKLVSIGGSISNITLISSGIGYTPASGSFTFNNVSFNTETGLGNGAVGIVTVSNGSVSGVVITTGGNNYSIGDVLSVPAIGIGIGTGCKFAITSIGSSNTFNIDNVRGDFSAGITTLSFINSSGITTFVGAGVTISSIINNKFNDGLHMKIIHPNHGMHSQSNYVTISNISSNISPTKLNQDITANTIGNILIENSSGFETFEGIGIGSTNPGYALIGEEIISYTITDSGIIGIQSRGIDGTNPVVHFSGEKLYKYEFNGVSLRRINKTHNFALVDNTDVHPIDLDSYYVKIDMSANGVDRSTNTPFPKLFFNKTSLESSETARATENIQFESIIPSFRTSTYAGTTLESRIRTITGSSVDGNEESFIDTGFQSITLNGITEFDTPRLIASNINESNFLSNIPANKSLTLELVLQSTNDFVSPVIDLEQTGLILTTNRLNNPVSNFALDGRVNKLIGDPHAAIYTSNKVTLKNPADSLKVVLSAKLSATNGIRVFYRLFRNDSIDSDQTWELFPGYSNIDSLGNTINSALSDGTPDNLITPESFGDFVEYEYTANNLSQFEGYQIKIVMFGTNQAKVPKLSDLRVVATA